MKQSKFLDLSVFYRNMNEYKMKPELLASTGWNISEKKLIIDDSVYDTNKNQWVILSLLIKKLTNIG